MVESWSSRVTADLYDRWARRFPMYRQTSADLVRVAALSPGERVVDLCCGTGIMTEEVLRAVGPTGRVWAVDSSAAMLDVARRNVDAPNVSFAHCPAESFDLVVDGPVDAVVCSSAFWHTDNAKVLGAARTTLRERGRFAFNISATRYSPDKSEEGVDGRRIGNAGHSADSPLRKRMLEAAVAELGYVPPPPTSSPRPVYNDAQLNALLTGHSFTIITRQVATTQATVESSYEWLRIPIFTSRLLPGLPYEMALRLLERAWAEVPHEPIEKEQWLHIVAERR